MARKKIRCLLLSFVVILLAYYISSEWVQLALIQGDSMLPTYHNLQMVAIDRHHTDFSRGDVVAFWCDSLSCVLVKRIVAEPEDTAAICNGTLLVNGEISTEYCKEGMFAFSGILETPILLGLGQYIVIGDNVAQSKDSRYPEIGVVHQKDILGKLY